jgi:hypothetical protein
MIHNIKEGGNKELMAVINILFSRYLIPYFKD